MKSLAIINQQGPLHSNAGQESVDLVLAAASFGQDVSVFFIDDGVFQLLKMQKPDVLEHKHFAKSFGAFEFYDVENIYVCQRSLTLRNIESNQLNVACQILSDTELNAKLANAHNIITLS
ncbi:sulfurtransferase complex subunit TusC [Aliiglaciecola lipolytica]|uniref:Protein tusC n=1 Tax=Aliiglaciecola lipolytica E3 TaxID=1127673 RepID=K6YAZ7_9ALTE|nr:sulfurtransferase complex subunit TusC [Aliiglaciecola lipolytica]GAC15352.1 protein tusC [Aliiglaciecola lipolytica E3]